MHPGLWRGRPAGALFFLLRLTQGLVALAGLRTLGFEGVASLGLCSFYFGCPRVWSPLQGHAPWALQGSPRWGSVLLTSAYPGFGRPCRATHPGLWRGRPARALFFLLRLTQGLVALAGLRTLGLEGVAPWLVSGALLWLASSRPLVACKGALLWLTRALL